MIRKHKSKRYSFMIENPTIENLNAVIRMEETRTGREVSAGSIVRLAVDEYLERYKQSL